MTQPIRCVFPGRKDHVAHARDFVRRAVGSCPVLDEAVLLASELCANALHTASGSGGLIEVPIYREDGSLRVEVRDNGSEAVPVVRSFKELSEGGRGLEIVRLIALRWGQSGDECVFFELRWDAHKRPSGLASAD
jgi:anti-sigma regulatory factor (Ser/Thr protein kinase)